MGKFLTSASRIKQTDKRRKYKLIDNELYKDDDKTIYLVWRNFETDNFTWFNSSEYDIRCSHIHDLFCFTHQALIVDLTEEELKQKGLLRKHDDMTICEDIPIEYLRIKDITGHETNNMFYRMLKCADCPKTPKVIQILYRAGVSLNLHWFLTGKIKIDLNNLYK